MLDLGVTRAILGTIAIEQPDVVANALTRFGAEYIAVGIDARDGLVRVITSYSIHYTKLYDASAPGTSFNVVREFSVVDTTSWAYVSQNGNNEQVLDYIRAHNPNRLELEKIARNNFV